MDSPWMSLDPGPYCAFPFISLKRRFLHHAAELRDHVEALLLAQVLRAHDRLLVEQVAGPGLLLEVTLDHVDGPIHVLAGWAGLVTFGPPRLPAG